jgi:hypothetical protein
MTAKKSAAKEKIAKFRTWLHKQSPWVRIPLGVLLVVGGLVGFLPVLGFWMVPLGLAVLAIDFPPARKAARKLSVWGGRAWKKFQEWKNNHNKK